MVEVELEVQLGGIPTQREFIAMELPCVPAVGDEVYAEGAIYEVVKRRLLMGEERPYLLVVKVRESVPSLSRLFPTL